MRVAMSTSSSKSPNNSPSEEEGGSELRRGPWTPEEDALLIHYIACRGEGRWNLLAQCSGLRRTGKSCRLRWLNYLKPDVKRGNLTLQEQLLILELHSKWGNRWSKIAQQLPGRTDNEIKNYWRTRVQKQARNLNIDCNSAAFQNVLRCFWTPRLLEKIEGSSSDVMSQNPTISPQPLTSHSTQHLSPQLIPQGPFPSVDDHTGTNSISANRDSRSLCSSESMNVSQVPEIYGYPNCPIQAIRNNNSTDYSTIPRHDDMEGSLSMAYMSAVGDFGGPVGDSQMVDGAWVENDLADSLWNIDESAILRASTRGSRF